MTLSQKERIEKLEAEVRSLREKVASVDRVAARELASIGGQVEGVGRRLDRLALRVPSSTKHLVAIVRADIRGAARRVGL